MTSENTIVPAGQVTTVEDFFEALRLRSERRGLVISGIETLKGNLEILSLQVGADEKRDFSFVSDILVAAAGQGNERAVSFATEYLNVMIKKEGPEALDEIKELYSDLDLTGLVPPEVSEGLDIKPEMLRLMQGSTVSPNWLAKSRVQEAETVPAKARELGLGQQSDEKLRVLESTAEDSSDSEILSHLSEKHPAIMDLLTNQDLWISGGDGHEYTQLRNIAALLVGPEWDNESILVAVAALRQTFIKSWKEKDGGIPKGKGEFGKRIPGYHTNHFVSRKLTEEFILHMHKHLRLTPYSSNKITEDAITHWPFTVGAENRKKKGILSK